MEFSHAQAQSFLQLIQELAAGNSLSRHIFTPWELRFLLDLANCSFRRATRLKMLRRYEAFVQKEMADGWLVPTRLSDFLAWEENRSRSPQRLAAAKLSSK